MMLTCRHVEKEGEIRTATMSPRSRYAAGHAGAWRRSMRYRRSVSPMHYFTAAAAERSLMGDGDGQGIHAIYDDQPQRVRRCYQP